MESEYFFYFYLGLMIVSTIGGLGYALRKSNASGEVANAHNDVDFLELRKRSCWKKLNLGAFVVTPMWLFANGYWVSMLIYLILAALLLPLALIISIVLFFIGTDVAAMNPGRWKNLEQFEQMQFEISVYGWLVIVIALCPLID